MIGVLFSTPCYGGMIHAAHFRSCMMLRADLTLSGIPHDWNIAWNESLVTRARNEMTATFLKTDWSHMFWLDADIEFTTDDVIKVLNLEADIGVGVYAMKKKDQQLFAAWKDGKLVSDLDQFSGPIEVDYAGTGFMCIKREVLEKLQSELEEFEYDAEELITALKQNLSAKEQAMLNRLYGAAASSYIGPNGRVGAFYMTPIHNDGFESEDYHFCRRARKAGFKVMMDPSVRLVHWGGYGYGSSKR